MNPMKKIRTYLMVALVSVSFFSCDLPSRFIVGTTLIAPLGPRTGAPASGYLWIDGDWFWNGRGYSWRDGYWSNPQIGYQWQPGSWKKKQGGYQWRPGRWK
jgi:hypothetical protein